MYRCEKCGKSFDEQFAAENEFLCSRKCGGRLLEAVDSHEPPPPSPVELNELPSIIAIPLNEYLNEKKAILKLWHACDVVELMLRLLTAVGFSYLMERKVVDDDLMLQFKNRIEEPTLGKWLGMAQAVSGRISNDEAWISGFRNVVEIIVPFVEGTESEKTPENSFSKLRNRLAHGGGITENLAEKLLNIWVPRFEALLQLTDWLKTFRLIVKQSDGQFGAMVGSTTKPVPISSSKPEVLERLQKLFDAGEEVVLAGKNSVLRLWPLAIFGLPRNPDPNKAVSTNPTPQIYVRKGQIRLQFTPIGSDEVCQSESDQNAFNVFEKLFSLREKPNEKFKITGFEESLRKDAARLIGREAELALIKDMVDGALNITDGTLKDRVLWVTGNAGIGKSFLMARIAAGYLDETPADTLILPYRFKVGEDYRCSRDAFLGFALERVKAFVKIEKAEEKKEDPLDELKELLENLQNKKVIFILDGLDELAASDSSFNNQVTFPLALPGTVWLCAGRPERGLPEIFMHEKCVHVFPNDKYPDGVPKMAESDIRCMITEAIAHNARLRKCLYENDKFADNDKINNPFISKVSSCADGLPVYVRYVINDILGGKLRVLDAGEQLPKSLAAYHEELLNRCGVGIFKQMLTPMVCHLAIAKEPLTPEQLAEILLRRKVLGSSEKALKNVQDGLAAIQTMIRTAPTSTGEIGFTMYHHSLREHMETSPTVEEAVATARDFICEEVMKEEAWKSKIGLYLLRWGVAHLVEAKRWDNVETMLTDLKFIEAKCAAGMTHELIGDYQAALQSLPEAMAEAEEERKNDERVQKYTQDMIEYSRKWSEARERYEADPEKNPMPESDAIPLPEIIPSARIWTDEEIDKEIERIKNNPTRLDKIKCFSQFVNAEAHNLVKYSRQKGFVIQQAYNSADSGFVTKEAERAVSDIKDAPLFLLKSGCRLPYNPKPALLRTLEGHTSSVSSVAATPDGKTAVSGSADKTLRVWEIATGKCIRTLKGHFEMVESVAITPDGKTAVSGSSDNTMRVWEIATGKCIHTLEGHTDRINSLAITPDGKTAVSGSHDNTMRVWEIATGKCIHTLEGHTDRINSLAITPDGKTAVSGSEDKILRVWDIASGKCLFIKPFSSSVNSFVVKNNILIVRESCERVNIFEIRNFGI